MPQLSLYMDNETMDKVRKEANNRNLSLSSYVAERLRAPLEPIDDNGWPESFWATYGALDDGFERPDQLDWALDAPRNSLED